MIHYLLLPIPFFFELYADWRLIESGKKDISITVRLLLVIAVSIQLIDWPQITLNFGYAILATVPFCFFDPALNKLRGLRWDYTGKTKNYDLSLAKINPVALLIGRFVLAAGLIVYWYNITFGR